MAEKKVKDCGGLKPYIPKDLKKAMKENNKKKPTTKKKVKRG